MTQLQLLADHLVALRFQNAPQLTELTGAVAYAKKLAPTMGKDQIIVINISGRGDKDCAAIARYRGENIYD